MSSAAITALSIYLPDHVRTNAYWREHHPDAVAAFERKRAAQVWEAPRPRTLFAAEMVPYLDDVFRGSVERRVAAPGETALAMEARAARRALNAAKVTGAQLDYVLLTSFFPDQPHHGNGALLAAALELTCPVWNTESACGSAAANLILATSLIESGRAQRVLVVLSCSYSRAFAQTNPMSWTSGDAATAFLVERVDGDAGVLGSKAVNSKETNGAFTWEIVANPDVQQTVQCAARPTAGAQIEEASERLLPLCCHGAAAASGVTLRDIAFFAMPTPTAWFSSFAQAKLGFTAAQTHDSYPRLSNIGPALAPVNLYYGAKAGQIAKGDLVLMMALGSVSSAGAVVLRWGDCALADETHD